MTTSPAHRSASAHTHRTRIGWLIAIVALFSGLLTTTSGTAAASVALGNEKSGNGNTFVLTDSDRTSALVPNSPTLTPVSDLGITEDEGSAAISLPFSFMLHGRTISAGTELTVSDNGVIFIGPTPNASYFNARLTNLFQEAAVIAPFWDDLNIEDCGDGVFADIFGESPNRIAVVEWRNLCDWHVPVSATDGYTFQARIFESGNVIEFHYSDVQGHPVESSSDNGREATIGTYAGTAGGRAYLEYAYNVTQPLPINSGGFAIRIMQCGDGGQHTVNTAGQLDAAIMCYNAQTPAGDHTINFSGGISHPQAPPVIDSATNAGKLTIDGKGLGYAGRFEIDNSGGSVTLQSMTITGEVYVDNGTLAVNQSTIQDADRGLILNGGTTTVLESTIRNHTTSSIDNVIAYLSIESSTIEGSTNGVRSFDGATSISNSTFHGNTTALSNVAGNVAVSNSTFAGNGIGISSSFQAAVASSIVDSCAGLVNDLGANFTTTATCLDFTQLSDDSLDTNLRNNAGHTKTIALLEGSNALAGGNCTSVPTTIAPDGSIAFGSIETDQRGAPRPTTGPCDAGAYEDAEVVCEPPNFTDVPGGAYYEASVDWAACTGLTNGTGPTTFSPSMTLSRAQMAAFLWRFADEPEPAAPHNFSDVPAGSYYDTAVAWLAEEGITTGTGPTTFSPNAAVTRAQMATFLWRFAGEPDPAAPHNFSDVPAGSYYDTAVAWLAEEGITTGTGPTSFGPSGNLTRAQTVTFLWRYNNLTG